LGNLFFLPFAIGRVALYPHQFRFNALGSTLPISKDEVCGRFGETVLKPHSAPWFPIEMSESLKLLQPRKDIGRSTVASSFDRASSLVSEVTDHQWSLCSGISKPTPALIKQRLSFELSGIGSVPKSKAATVVK